MMWMVVLLVLFRGMDGAREDSNVHVALDVVVFVGLLVVL
jgi:hypothetical protein